MKKKLFDKILKGAKEAADYAEGKPVKGAREYIVHVPNEVDVKEIRAQLGMTQQAFSKTFGFSLSGLRKWEAQKRMPEGSARVLLKMISRDPNAVLHLAH